MLHDVIKGCHELHEVMAGHCSRHAEHAKHGAAPHVLSQRRHLAAAKNKHAVTTQLRKRVRISVRWNKEFIVQALCAERLSAAFQKRARNVLYSGDGM